MNARPFLLFFALSALGQDPDYFPLQTGNQWIYRPTAGLIQADPWTIEVGASRTINGNQYFAVTGFVEQNPLLLRHAGSTLVYYDNREQRERPWANFAAPLDQPFAAEIDACSPVAAVTARDAAAKLAIGEFPNALTLTYQPRCADAGITTEVFLPGVGLAKRSYSSIAGPRTFELVYARIAGFTVFSESEHSFHLTLDQAAYTRNSPITARLTLRNTTPRPLPLVFLGSQDFDIVIRDAQGEPVWRWSDGKAFTRELRPVAFNGEKNWVESIRLDLAPGNYTAIGSLAVMDVKYESTISFRVDPAR